MLLDQKSMTVLRKILFSGFVLFVGMLVSFADIPSSASQTASLFIRKVERAPVIDGNLSDSCWLTAPVAKDFVQRQPNEGQPASEKTEVRVCRDERNLFIGVRCFDSQPNKIAAKVMQRDATVKGDDYFLFFLIRTAVDAKGIISGRMQMGPRARSDQFRYQQTEHGLGRDLGCQGEDR